MSALDGIVMIPLFLRKGKHARPFLADASPSQQDYWIADGTLPKPIQLSPRVSGWFVEDLVTHIRKMSDERKGRSAA